MMISSYYIYRMLQKSRAKKETKHPSEHSKPSTKPNRSADVGDFTKKCRVCLDKGKIPIEGNPTSSVGKALKLIVDIDVGENYGYPKYMCVQCYTWLRGAVKLINTARETERILKQMKPNINFEIESLDGDNFSEVHYIQDGKISILDQLASGNSVETKPAQSASYNSEQEDETLEHIQQKMKKEKLQCRICKKHVTKYYYKEHLAIHGVGKQKPKLKMECKICQKTLEKAYYKQHMAVVHGQEHSKYVCYVCGKTFRFQSGYKSHILSHNDDFPFKCHLCPYRGRHSGLLKTHMRVHTRDYRFQCTECPSRFLTSGNLNKHMLKHRERTFRCETCSRAFHSQIEVDKHHQVDHLGIKNHICNICEKAFGYRSAMMKHQLHVHKRQKLLNGRVPSYLVAEQRKQDIVSGSTGNPGT